MGPERGTPVLFVYTIAFCALIVQLSLSHPSRASIGLCGARRSPCDSVQLLEARQNGICDYWRSPIPRADDLLPMAELLRQAFSWITRQT